MIPGWLVFTPLLRPTASLVVGLVLWLDAGGVFSVSSLSQKGEAAFQQAVQACYSELGGCAVTAPSLGQRPGPRQDEPAGLSQVTTAIVKPAHCAKEGGGAGDRS